MAKIRWVMAAVVLAAMGAGSAFAQQGTAPEMFPFVLPWDDGAAGPTDVSGWMAKPAGKAGVITVKDGHLFEGDKRIRFFGVNMAFDANFPVHADAEKIAARLAKFGVNCVRFHHMDTVEYPVGLLEKDGVTINKDYLDRLDYFIAQLKAHGVYSNINLHVGRHYPGMPDAKGNDYYKGIDQFYPAMIRLQKDFARDLLKHVNPYTKTTYTDEPAVAFVEINNENGLVHSWWSGQFNTLAPAFKTELATQWNVWLKAKYGSDASLLAAWPARGAVNAEDMLEQDFSKWWLEEHGGSSAKMTESMVKKSELPQSAALAGDRVPVVTIVVDKPGMESWHVQASRSGLALKAGQAYRVELWARASKPREATIVAAQAHEPWSPLETQTIKVTEKWQKFSMNFSAGSADEPNARVAISGLGTAAGDCQIAGVTMRPERMGGLLENESLGHVGILTRSDYVKRAADVQRDWIRFIYDTEEKYWLDMQDFVKKDLHVKAPVIGTQMGYSPFSIQAKLDVVDVHGYWRHPEFPGQAWNDKDWVIKTDSMVRAKGAGELGWMAGTRVYGKPYICTEYNHSAPNQFSSEAFLLAAAYAAQQDWDGIFAFAYSHNLDAAKSGKISGFFDLAQHPTKMATLPAAYAMFVRGDILAWNHQAVPPTAMPTLDEVLEQIRLKEASPKVNFFRKNNPVYGLWEPMSIAVAGTVEPMARYVSWRSQIRWAADKGIVTFYSEKSAGVVGYADNLKYWLGTPPANLMSVERRTPAGWVAGQPPFDQRWCTITATVMDGKDFASAQHVLIVATGAAENTNIGWKNPEKTTVGRDWGEAPSLVEGIDATITLPAEGMKVWALDERGQRKEEVPAVKDAAGSRFEIGPKYRTIWYEAAR